MDPKNFFYEEILFSTVFFTVAALLCFISYEAKPQSNDKPDLRNDSCVNCKGQANNFVVLNAYFSDVNGEPNENLCEGGPYFISILYTSSQNNSVNNFRIIADILKKDQSTDAILESNYMNEFKGTVPPCNSATCVITVPIPNLNFECQNEYYELSNPMSFWTQAGNKNLEDSYKCNDYPTAQCSHSSSIPIEVGTLDYNFDVNFECFQENLNHTNVSFFITSLFGGNPTQEYNVLWNFEFEDGTIINSSDINPSFQNVESGEIVTASLTVSQGSLNGSVIENTYTIPIALNENEVIESSTITEGDKGEANGSIEVEFRPGNFFYFWTSLDDPDFYSEEKRIEDLPEGTYRLTTFDEDTGLCRTDIFEITFSILPVELKYFEAEHFSSEQAIKLTWATAKEWESSHFEVFKSFDNIENWQKIAEIDAAGYSEKLQYYEFIDTESSTRSSMVYYQLRQVDFDGTYEKSKVVGVQVPSDGINKKTWKIYPNPVENQSIHLILAQAEDYKNEAVSASLINPIGSTYYLNGPTIEALTEEINLVLSQNSKGVYVLQIAWDKETQQLKILKR
ncbi:T9SS type A sorting domain-containing protein [Arthrospiribacter ruber]|uniref:T9SS C-terminal target domain-containing protein n=1 Tax=Arthrospiribacter ruber TaxID=2487934 RepID=A0A951IXY7_9BACT|nr:T9SS type A sorting domain-containing protein [Arthrospiribacter ruber]MBW3469205.1 T9SS C-terminal target domain-containing protein [Arthrospiribacter ruber]